MAATLTAGAGWLPASCTSGGSAPCEATSLLYVMCAAARPCSALAAFSGTPVEVTFRSSTRGATAPAAEILPPCNEENSGKRVLVRGVSVGGVRRWGRLEQLYEGCNGAGSGDLTPPAIRKAAAEASSFIGSWTLQAEIEKACCYRRASKQLADLPPGFLKVRPASCL